MVARAENSRDFSRGPDLPSWKGAHGRPPAGLSPVAVPQGLQLPVEHQAPRAVATEMGCKTLGRVPFLFVFSFQSHLT